MKLIFVCSEPGENFGPPFKKEFLSSLVLTNDKVYLLGQENPKIQGVHFVSCIADDLEFHNAILEIVSHNPDATELQVIIIGFRHKSDIGKLIITNDWHDSDILLPLKFYRNSVCQQQPISFDKTAPVYRCKEKTTGVSEEEIKQFITSNNTINDLISPSGSKNLIYFVCNNNDSYVTMLGNLVNSIEAVSPNVDFDYLVIGGNEARLAVDNGTNRNVLFFHKEESDPVFASMLKLDIFDFVNLGDYAKILFLDCDMLAFSDFSPIFNEPILSGVLYSYHNPRVSMSSHLSLYHGLQIYGREDLDFFRQNNIYPFNAGQFLFKNDSVMRGHFRNVKKLYEMWNGRFFYEQSFMNHYFNMLRKSDTQTLSKYFQFVDVTSGAKNENIVSPFVHFIGKPGHGSMKLNEIQNFMERR